MRVIEGDCRDVLAEMPADSIDAVVTDPPYHLTSGNIAVDWGAMSERSVAHGGGGPKGPTNGTGRGHKTGFMGKAWDGGDVAFQPDTWRAVYRVLKPGAHMLVFGGTRTSHRMVCAIEDAGFEIRDTLCWLYGSGFPKSLDVSKAIDRAAGAEREVVGQRVYADGHIQRNQSARNQSGRYNYSMRDGVDPDPMITAPATPEAAQWEGWGTALKPAHEPIVLARKPLGERSVAANVLRHGTGAINIDASRVQMGAEYDPNAIQRQQSNRQTWEGGAASGLSADHVQPTYNAAGRWPANCVHDGSDEVEAAFAAFGESTSSGGSGPASQRWTGADGLQGFGFKPKQRANAGGLGDTGSASRFFYNAGERGRRPGGFGNVGADKGDSAPNGPMYQDGGSPSRFFYSSKATASDRADSRHPTVKPIALLQWLVRMITPPGGTCLDPFAGSGTTGEACMLEGFDAILIEQSAEHVADIRHRMARWSGGDMPLFAPVPAPPEDARIEDLFREPETTTTEE